MDENHGNQDNICSKIILKKQKSFVRIFEIITVIEVKVIKDLLYICGPQYFI